MKYADDLVLLAKEEKVLQNMTEKLVEIGRCYGMEMKVEKTKFMRISRQPFPVKIMIGQKQLENVESFKYLCSMLTNDERCTCEIKSRIAMAKAAFNKKRALFTSTLDLNYIYTHQTFGTANLILKVLLHFVALYCFQVGCDALNNNDQMKRRRNNP